MENKFDRKVYTNTINFKAQNALLDQPMPYAENLSALKEPLDIMGKTIQNRLACQAMEGCDGKADGSPDELTYRRYRRFAKGGAGLIWFEATACLNEGRANPRQLMITEQNLDEFKRIVEEIKLTGMRENGFEPVVIMQDTHSGRYSKPEGVPAPIIAYNNPIFEKDNPISADRIATDEYLDKVSEALIKNAVLAEKAGFDGVDIKSCHRYLLSELLSAYNRDGKYGGDYEGRTRMLKQTVKGTIDACSKDFIVSSRLNVYDGFEYPYGFGVKQGDGINVDLAEPKKLIGELYDMGMRIINISMGNPYFNPHVNRPFAAGGYTADEFPIEGVARVQNGVKELKTALPYMKFITSALSFLGTESANVAAGYIENNSYDMAGYGRMIFAYPDFANDIVNGNGLQNNKCCICCSKCTELMRAGGTPGCIIRDSELYMPMYREKCMNK